MRLDRLILVLILVSLFYPLIAKEKKEEEASKSAPLELVVDKKNFEEGYVERQVLRYEAIIKQYREELRSLIKRSVEEKKRVVEKKYAPTIKKELENEQINRMDATALFEVFIKKYPENEKYTPGAMYRLAELYYEHSMLEHEKKVQKYEKELLAYEEKRRGSEPELPAIDFDKTIYLYDRIIKVFPKFKYLGAVYYMLGYCYAESGQGDKAVATWLELIEKKIKTPYLAELYLRVGDYYFNTNNLIKAEEYFLKGIVYKEDIFYDKILYKLAWTYYRQSKFQDAIDSFVNLVNYADEMKEKGVDKGQDLRKEAIQYMSISYADEDWGSVEKAIEYFSGIQGIKFEKDVFEQLGKYYYENSSFSQAEKAYKFVLERHPNYENAPRIHHKLIQLYNKAREFDKASAETEIFSQRYASDGEWARINRGNATAVREAAEWAKNALLDTASFHHRMAQKYKQDGEEALSVEEYKIAAIAYGEYLVKFPYTSESYDITYNFADTLFQSGDIEMAVVVYERIRDDKNQDRLREDSAFQTFVCYTMLWGKSPERLVESEKKRGKPFSNLEKKLIESSDSYLKSAKEVEDKPVVAYTVGRIFFDHGKFEDAEKRYLKIISEFSGHKAAILAARDIISAYTEKKDWVNVAKWSKILTDRLSEKENVSKELKQEFTTYRAGALFMYAQKLEEEKKYKKAAQEYLRLVEENPYNNNADKALSNAAINFQRATMFDSALKLHERIYKEYPYSALAPQSLYLVAYNAERSYSFEKAVDAYQQLYKKYPMYEKKSAALYNAGFLLERLQRYSEASSYYKLYYSEENEKIEGKEALYMAGLMYKKAKKWSRMIKSFENFISTFRNDSEVGHLVMRAYYQIAKIYEEKLNKWRKAKKYYSNILKYLEEKDVKSEEALLYAAEAKFKLLEDDFNDYIKIRIGGKDDKQLEESLKTKIEVMKELEASYKEVLKYKVYTWVIASIYRMGILYQSFSDTLFNAEPPKGLSYEEEELYMQMLQDQAAPIEEKAVAIYSSGLTRAREMKVFNKWTQLITEKLSVMRPAEYKVGKMPRFAIDSSLETGYPILLSLDKSQKKIYSKKGMSGSETKSGKEKKSEEKKDNKLQEQDGKGEKK